MNIEEAGERIISHKEDDEILIMSRITKEDV